MGKINLALLAGGWSGEREISLQSGDAVYRALDKRKYNVTRYDPRDDLVTLIKERGRIDLAFVLLHGKFGEDGCMQGFLDLLGIPFVGSGVLSSAMSLNKKLAKQMYMSAGLNVIKDVILCRGQNFTTDHIMEIVGPSTVVKPVTEGSSLGMSVCHSEEDLLKGIHIALEYGQEIMIEQYVKGVEITCCVIGNRTLDTMPLIEIVPNSEYAFFDYDAKYTPGATREICPARLVESQSRRVQSCAKKAHKVLKCEVWSRTDMIIQGDKIYLLETNTIPGMTENSLVPLAAKAAGMSLSHLADKLVELSLELTDSR